MKSQSWRHLMTKRGKLTSAEHNPRAHEAKIRNFFHPSLRGLSDKPTFMFISFFLYPLESYPLESYN